MRANKKLHLGCGDVYLPGYSNIDYPPSEHTVQQNTKVDLYADLTKLQYEPKSIAEIRLHHVFEHFTRPVACGLLAAWQSWLKPGGILRIEVPNFKRTALILLNPFLYQHSKTVALRHIFGSHEAPWAVHCEGWTTNRLTGILKNVGFEILKINKTSWKGTYNFEIIARKKGADLSKTDLDEKVKTFLADYLVDLSKSELKLLDIWMDIYKRQAKNCWARG